MVSSSPVWAALIVPGALAVLVAAAAVLDACLSSWATGTPALSGAVRPFRDAARLLVQQRRTTVAPDALLWRFGGAGMLVVAGLMLVVVPVGSRSVTDLPIGIVWFNMCDVTLWAVVWLAGWGPNSHLPLVGAYRWLSQALAYELPLMFALIAPAVAAESLRVGDVVRHQQGLWFGAWMPVAFAVFLVAVAGFAQWGPFAYPHAGDIAGGTDAESSGVDRLVLSLGRYALLGAGSAFAAAVFLGAGDGPVLPGWLWSTLKTLAVLGVVVAIRSRLPTVRMERFTEIGWLVLLPASLVQLLAVTLVVLFGLL